MAKEGVEDQEGHVGNHGGGGEVSIERAQDVLRLLIRVGGHIATGSLGHEAVIDIVKREAISSDIPVLVGPVGVNLEISRVTIDTKRRREC